MMKILRLKLERILPFLSVPKLGVPSDKSGVKTGAIPPEALRPGASYSHLELRGVEVKGQNLKGLRAYRALLDRSRFNGVDLSKAIITHSRLRECRFEGSQLAGVRWTVVDAEGAQLTDCDMKEARLAGISLRDGRLTQVDLSGSELLLADLFGVRLKDVNLKHACLTGADLSFSTLESVDLSQADLRGCTFGFSEFQAVVLEGARLEDADFRGVRGLSREQRGELRRQGARLRTGWIERPVGALMEKVRPEMHLERIDTLVRRISLAVKAFGLIAVVGITLQLFWSGALAPQPHGDESLPVNQGAPLTEPTIEEVAQTKENLIKLRQAIKNAYEASGRYGVVRYPTIEDLSANQFDRDGFGPGDDKLPLLPGGIPQNFLTTGEGVAPYCNDPATQQTLTGDNTDWHYCAETGRIFACGGFTTAPTLEW